METKTIMTTYGAIYARVSSKAQDGDDKTSIRQQIEACMTLAEQRDYTVKPEHVFKDAHTGEEIERPGLNDMLEAVLRSEVDVVLCQDIDRLSRIPVHRMLIEKEVANAGARIEYALIDYGNNDEGELHKFLISGFAYYENRKRIARSKNGKLGKTKLGLTVASFAPYGYKFDYSDNGKQRGFVINEEEAVIVRMVFDWYLNGDENCMPIGISTIARRLTAMQVPNRNHRNKPQPYYWFHKVVREMLESETYIGTWYYNRTRRIKQKNGIYRQVPRPRDEWVPVQIPPLVTTAMHEEVLNRFMTNQEQYQRRYKHHYILSGRLTCGVCGKRYVGKKQYWKKGLYYFCGSRNRDYELNCTNPSFYEDELEPVIWEWVRGLLDNPQLIRDTIKAKENYTAVVRLRQRFSLVEQELDKKRAEYEKLIGLYLKGDMPESMLDGFRKPLEAAVNELEQEYKRLKHVLHKNTYSAEQIDEIIDICDTARKGLNLVGNGNWVSKKQQIYQLLEVHATLCVEDGQKIAHCECVFGERMLVLAPVSHS